MRLRISFLILVSFILPNSLPGQGYSFEKVPDWVKEVTIPSKLPVSKYEIMSGFYEMLIDYQINLEKNMMFCREVRNVVSYSGITNASQISVSFDTSYQKLYIHHLYIWRKWIKTDRTHDLTLELMNNEQNLQQGIYTGQVTAYDILNDVRKDDLIEFAYTLVGKNPIFENGKYLFIPLEAMNPIDLLSMRVIYPKDKDYVYNCVGCDSLIQTSEKDGYKQLELKQEDIKALQLEENTPPWVIPYKYFTLSSFRSWREVNTWAQSVFALKKEPELSEVFHELFSGTETTEEKINKIINFVQDDIRYMGVESGIGSIKPASPEKVIKQRFGDCKDKSLLLVSLLKKIGVTEAYPVLVNTDLQSSLVKLGPSNEVFNHCITTFNYENQTYWVDPTIGMQGGDFKNISIINFDKALIIGKPSDSLHTMVQIRNTPPDDIVDEYTIESFTEPAKLKITSIRYGFEADMRRSLVEYISANKLQEIAEADLKEQYPEVIKTADIDLHDDILKNIFTTNYQFDVGGFWQDGDKGTNEAAKGLWVFRFEPQTMYREINKSSCEKRKYEYAVYYPLNFVYRVIFHFPKPMIIDDNYTLYDNNVFTLEEVIEQLSSNSIQIEYTYKTKSNSIKPGDYMQICEEKNKIAKQFPLVIYFPK
ncbi:MAG TPA: DUF3857 domain-containing protein [Bacteroidia bacterium]|nr:DUF3857 domain-containing protein [Bacteroidia bacterium]